MAETILVQFSIPAASYSEWSAKALAAGYTSMGAYVRCHIMGLPLPKSGPSMVTEDGKRRHLVRRLVSLSLSDSPADQSATYGLRQQICQKYPLAILSVAMRFLPGVLEQYAADLLPAVAPPTLQIMLPPDHPLLAVAKPKRAGKASA
jgi:hypothetical protein